MRRTNANYFAAQESFSLRDEMGECPNSKIDIDVIDESSFFVRHFPISEDDKPIMDWQMETCFPGNPF